MLFSNSENFYINSDDALAEVLSIIRQEKVFALDTEFTRQSTYYPILSLIQIAVVNAEKEKSLYIVDCLCNLDLTEFYKIIADKNIIKILHSSVQDLQIFFYKSNLIPASIFDTQIMANFCGLDYGCGYSSLVRNLFDKTLDKEQQRSDWQIRPLSNEQINYALLDVFFLHEIYEGLLKNIHESGRLTWLEEEMLNFTSNAISKSEESLLKNFITKRKSSVQIEMLKRLVFLREEWAKKLDVPRQRVIRDEVIEKMIYSKKIISKIDDRILGDVEEILSIQDDFVISHIAKNRSLAMDLKQKEDYAKAKEEIKIIAQDCGLKEQFLISNSDLKKIIQEKEIIKKIKSSWRYHLFGKKLEQIIV